MKNQAERLSDEEKRQIFDTIYEDLHDLQLPNPLWGIHRDPEQRRYIAFTMFDANQMKCSIAVKITDTFDLNVFADGIQKSSDTLNELSLDSVAKLLHKFSENVNH